jgi:hypothetical protein
VLGSTHVPVASFESSQEYTTTTTIYTQLYRLNPKVYTERFQTLTTGASSYHQTVVGLEKVSNPFRYKSKEKEKKNGRYEIRDDESRAALWALRAPSVSPAPVVSCRPIS